MNTGSDTSTTKCKHCHRILHAAASIARKAGRWCAAKAARLAAVARGFKAEQVDKALELIADKGLAVVRKGIYRVVSSDGERTYLAHSATCNCPAGLRSRNRCYHSLAVRILITRGARRWTPDWKQSGKHCGQVASPPNPRRR